MTAPDLIALTCVSNSPAWLEEMARAYSGEQAALLERRILEGENRIELDYAPDVMRGEMLRHRPPRRVVYLVPSWLRRPRDRAKVEFARWRWRRRRVVDPTRHTTEGPFGSPQALNEIDLRGVPTTRDTAVTLGRRRIREYEVMALPIAHPVVLLYTDVGGAERTLRLP